MQSKYFVYGLLALFVLSASGADDYSGDWSGEDYEAYDDELTTEGDHSGDGELTPTLDEEVGVRIINDNLNTTVANNTPAVNVNLMETKVNLTTTTAAPVVTTEQLIEIDLPVCPEKCECTDGTQFVNCSHRHLTLIPLDLPSDAIKIDLSHNKIEVFNVSDIRNCTKLRELLLQGNQIHAIEDTTAFEDLRHLDHINLASNLLTNLSGEEFTDAKQLTKLTLSHNALVVEQGKVLVNVSDLEVLNLVGCNITELYNSTFAPLDGLLSLNLNKNPLNEKINVHAFHSLKRLKELHIPKIDEEVSLDLCNTLSGIDGVHIGTFEISCFELASGASFEDSTVLVTPRTASERNKVHHHHTESAVASENSTTERMSTLPLGSPERALIPTTSEKVDIPLIHNSNKPSENNDKQPPSPPIEKAESNGPTVVVAGKDKSNPNQVEMTANSINNILIGIIIVAILGLIIGVICRQDCFGVKTRLCRTRRPAATDQVRPAEEVPLNKV